MKFRGLTKLLEDDGWEHVRTTGSPMHFQHPTKTGLLTVPGGGKLNRDVAKGTLRALLRQAEIDPPR